MWGYSLVCVRRRQANEEGMVSHTMPPVLLSVSGSRKFLPGLLNFQQFHLEDQGLEWTD